MGIVAKGNDENEIIHVEKAKMLKKLSGNVIAKEAVLL